MFQGIHSTVIGDSHVKRGVVCQDSSGIYLCDEFGIAVVADGHGSEKHFRSDVGSNIAVKITTGLLQKYMRKPDFKNQFLQHPNFILHQMEKQILMKWREAIQEYHQENPLSAEEEEKHHIKERPVRISTIYGSTVLAAIMAEGFSFGMVLGDGGFVVMDEDGGLSIPIEDQNSRANYTSSLCNTDAVNYFEHWYTKGNPRALFVSTDGLFKSFASDEDFLKYHGLIMQMTKDQEKMIKSLERNFNRRTIEGSGDDISLAMVYRNPQ